MFVLQVYDADEITCKGISGATFMPEKSAVEECLANAYRQYIKAFVHNVFKKYFIQVLKKKNVRMRSLKVDKKSKT